jgi:hypothetical protein
MADEKSAEGADPKIPEATDLDGYLSELVRKSFGGDIATGDASAPIILPDKEDLTVRLVSQHSLERLRDAESDKSIFDNLLWCLLGGVLGFFTNVVTADKISIKAAGFVFIAFMTAAAITSITLRRRLSRRLQEARRRVHVGKDLPP